jgi:transcription initiation factor TFIIIB Brf1 subunit/transcription initiation factor TFIIB
MSFKCPNCQTTLYSRVHRLCQACGVALPAELLLPEAEIRHFEEKMEREKKAMLEADKNINTSGPDTSLIGGL